jgi:hypothetical protein
MYLEHGMLHTTRVTRMVPVGFTARFCESCRKTRAHRVRRERVRRVSSVGPFSFPGREFGGVDEYECDFCTDVTRVAHAESARAEWSPVDGLSSIGGDALAPEEEQIGPDDVKHLLQTISSRGFLLSFVTLWGFWLGGFIGLAIGAALVMRFLPSVNVDEPTRRALALLAFAAGVLGLGAATGLPEAARALRRHRTELIREKLHRYQLRALVESALGEGQLPENEALLARAALLDAVGNPRAPDDVKVRERTSG